MNFRIKSGMIKTTIREIKASLGRYLAIFAIVMLGVGFFAGLKATKPAMIATVDDYLRRQDFFDFKLLSTIGFGKEDTKELFGMSEVGQAEGAVSADVLCFFDDGNSDGNGDGDDAGDNAENNTKNNEEVYHVHTMPENINRIVLLEGRLPERADECVLDSAVYGADMIGAEITVTEHNEEDTLEMFEERTFTAVGIVRSPYYINFERGTSSIGEGKVAAFFYVPKEAFSCDYLTEIYLTTGHGCGVYTDEYEEHIDGLLETIEQKTEALVTDRYNELVTQAQEKIDEAQSELDEKTKEAKQKLSDAADKIKDGRKELRDGRKEIAEGEKKLADGRKELAEGEIELKNHEQELKDAQRQILAKEQELLDGEAQVSRMEREISENEKKAADGRAQLAQALKQLKDKETIIKQQEAALNEQESELSKKQKELSSQLKALEKQQKELEAGREELSGRLEQLEQAYAAQLISQEEYDANLAALQAGLQQTASGESKLLKGKKQLQAGIEQIQSGMAEIQSGRTQIQSAKKQAESAAEQLAQKEQELAAADAQLAEGRSRTSAARAQLTDGRTQLAGAKAELEEGRRQLADGRAELADAKAELADARKEIKKGKADLKKGRRKLAGAKQKYEDSKDEFRKKTADAQEKIDDARADLDEIEAPDYYALDRNTNIGYACYESDAGIVAAIADVFPLFFFLVAALVCMTTMNRMVEEQRTQIGVLKALGYGNAAIMGKYLFYAGSAAAAGAVAGCAVGTWLFPKVIWMGYSIMYSMGEIQYLFEIRLAVLSIAAALLCSVGAAYLSCRYELYSVPADLIRPKAPKSGRRIFLEKIPFIWSRMKFLHKVSIRNVVRYKKRFFMMILGIGGCTALLVTGFGIKDSVTNIADMQYDEIQIYDINITFKDPVQKSDLDGLAAQMKDTIADAACRFEESVDLDFNGRTKSIYLEIPENPEDQSIFLDLHTKGGEKIAYPAAGEAVISQKLADNLGIRTGDSVVLRDHDMNSLTVTIAALCENFVYNYIYISKETYQEQLGRKPEYKSAYVNIKEGTDIHAAAAQLSDQSGVLAVSVTKDMRDRIGSMMESLDYIVLLIVVCAGSLAFIVLYNLTNINITERMREIATIKVLGFYAKETADYVFRENLALTAIGAVIGLGLGKWLHWFVMYQVNIDMLSFKTVIHPVSYMWSLVLTFFFALLVNAVMYFKLEKINMAESLKSIE